MNSKALMLPKGSIISTGIRNPSIIGRKYNYGIVYHLSFF